jgi:uncharacterized protein (DUF2236 family)
MDHLRMLDPRNVLADSTAGLFSHAEYPLAHSLDYAGDVGLFGPGSASWHVLGDVSAFVGGIRALLVQAAHPEVVAGVADHSTYEQDPLGRLSRTSAYVTATGYGAMPEVEAALRLVRRAHTPVKGVSHRGAAYTASGGEFASWVHNVLIDSFITAHQIFGREPLSAARADSFVEEQSRLGERLGANDLPVTTRSLHDWVRNHPALDASPGMESTVRFLRQPPLPFGVGLGYRVLFHAAVATTPVNVRDLLGVRSYPGALVAGRTTIRTLQWSMGSSPSWWIALQRTGETRPDGVIFRRPPPAVGAPELFDAGAQ